MLAKHFDAISYSWKTNPEVGKVLAEKSLTDFSIISINELKQFLEMTNNSKLNRKVWFFPLAINNEDLDFLFQNSVNQFVVDNENDLDTILKYIETNNKKVNILLRMKLRENTIFTGKHYVFGMKVKVIQKWIPILKSNKNIDLIGVHFHRKTQNVSEWSLKEEVAQSLGEEYLSQLDIMNLGGGMPANYCNIHDKAVESIILKIKDLKDYISKFNIKLYIEPGRFIAAPAVKLETNIIAIHDNALFLNISIFNGALDTVVANIKLHVKEEIEKGEKYLLKGCTPDSSDILRYSVYLKKPKIGDKITFENCGAYTYTTDFCALDKIEYIIEN
jgi:ornithine decarboxylase